MVALAKLLDELPYLMREDEDEFVLLNTDVYEIERLNKAKGSDVYTSVIIEGECLPTSQMRVGADEISLYIIDWLYRKYFD